MTPQTPLREDAQRALSVFADATSRPLAPSAVARTWERAVERRQARARFVRLGLAFSCSFLAGVALTLGVMGWARRDTPPVSPVATVEVVAAGQYSDDGRSIRLERGSLRVKAHGAARELVTHELTVSWSEGRVLVEAAAGRTVLVVEEGSVVYRDASGTHRVDAGQRVVVPVELFVAPSQDVAGCEGLAGGAIDACLQKAAEGAGLAAQTALFERGLRAHEAGEYQRAAALFLEHQRRFPDGVFAPEVSIALMLEHRALGHTDAALAEVAAFLSRFPTDARASDVALWRAQIQ